MNYLIREATLPDAEGVAIVHVESWKTTYAGMLPDELIASRTLERRKQQWTTQLSTDNPARRLFVAEADGQIVAYAQFGITRWPDFPYTHELFAIYSLKAVQGQGIGRALIRAGANWLVGQGAQSMILWVLADNMRARGFYERMGGTFAAERIDPDFNVPVKEAAYGWNTLETLLKTVNS